ncbi:F-actin-capping protein [Tyrophagus putrescentiae]|nr:F-actin-capping protein [Tyrophagus putrescentiae]
MLIIDLQLRIVADFILHAPPGEFREVFNDVRHLLNNDNLLKDKAFSIFGQYRKDQLTPVQVDGSEELSLITEFNELSPNRFYDPKSRKSFKYDYLSEECSEYQPWEPDQVSEPWRAALEEVWSNYCADHYFNGISAVFSATSGGQIILSACSEGHQFQPQNFWNGLWRSVWSIKFTPNQGKAELQGKIKAQVHYYENGNVQLVSYKDVNQSITVTNEKQLAENIKQIVEETENDYQVAISKNYQNMSDTTFKALRRALPVTRSKIDWNKIMSYRIGNELKQN